MNYLNLNFYIFVVIIAVIYYVSPFKYRWISLLLGNMFFYFSLLPSIKEMLLFASSIVSCYIFGIVIDKNKKWKHIKFVLLLAIFLSGFPLYFLKIGVLFNTHLFSGNFTTWIVPIGMSFYTLEMISYLVDIYSSKIQSQRNIFRFTLYISFFPKLIQGPISRYNEINEQLFEGNKFVLENIVKSIQLVIYGFFLKFMIADKSAIFVNNVFSNYQFYRGYQVWIAAILYSVQLYADFLSCTMLSRGIALAFGIKLKNNFSTPYFSTSIKEFWHNWHITFSSWLRDYVYIPLGGNKKGKLRKYINLIVTFIISGLWHGNGLRFIVWGLMHAFYQIAGEITYKVRNKIYEFLDMPVKSFGWKLFKSINTFLLVTFAWSMFRADSLTQGIEILKSMFLLDNPWVLFDNSLFALGLDWKEFFVLTFSIVALITVGILQKRISISNWLIEQGVVVQCFIYGLMIIVIMIFGTYGFGFNALDFIYGGF